MVPEVAAITPEVGITPAVGNTQVVDTRAVDIMGIPDRRFTRVRLAT